MYSIQEMVQREDISENLKKIESYMDTRGAYHPQGANIYSGLSRSVQRSMAESIRHIPLKEFLGVTGTTGIAGAAYLVPVKLYDTLLLASQQTDLVPLVSAYVVEDWRGGSLDIPIVKHDSLRGRHFGSGGALPSGSPDTVKATVTTKKFGYNFDLDNALLEDNTFGLVEWNIRNAGFAMGYEATELALAVLKAAADGDGTLNSGTSASTDTTLWDEVLTGVDAIGNDEFVPNTLLTTPESWHHNIGLGAAVASAADTYWKPPVHVSMPQPAQGFDLRAQMLDVKLCTSPQLHDSADAAGAAFTTCVSVIFDRANALLTGRKRWLQIENYAKPVEDLSGAVVVGEQDSVSIYDDCVYTLTEKT